MLAGSSTESTETLYRTVFISDVHLGSPDCKAETLLDFLRHVACERMYLVGDILDFWSLRRIWHWEQAHNDVIQKILRKARKGTQVIYIPGNHDDAARDFVDMRFGGIEVRRQAEHTTATGRRLLIMHGDEFDAVMGYAGFFHPIGPFWYQAVRGIARILNTGRRIFGHKPWSLAKMIAQAENAFGVKTRFRDLAVAEGKFRGFDGVVCGHIHWPLHEDDGQFVYANSGDWVDHCSAIVEHLDGRLELIRWQL